MKKNNLFKIFTLGAALALASTQGLRAQANGFTGSFDGPDGARFDEGYQDIPGGITISGDHVYVTGVKYDNFFYGSITSRYGSNGDVVFSSATLAGGEPRLNSIAVNGNGVYGAGTYAGGFVTAKYANFPALAVSSTVPGDQSVSGLALDLTGNVFVIGSNHGEAASQNDVKIVKYDLNLNQQGAPLLLNAGGLDYGTDIIYASGYLYAVGVSSQGANTALVLSKLSTGFTFISSAAYFTDLFYSPGTPGGPKVAFNSVTNELVVSMTVMTGSNPGDRASRRARIDLDLNMLDNVNYAMGQFALGTDIAVDGDGNIYALVKSFDGAWDYAEVLKCDSSLSLLDSSSRTMTSAHLVPYAIAIDSMSRVYATGHVAPGGNQMDIVTVRFPFSASEGGVEGSISYAGPQEGALIVALFDNPAFEGAPVYQVSVSTLGGPPWAYSIGSVSPGNYYLGATMVVNGPTPDDLVYTDPWAIVGGSVSPTQVVVANTLLSGYDMTLVNGTLEEPNPFASAPGYTLEGNVSYSGAANGAFKIAISSVSPQMWGAGTENVLQVTTTSGNSFIFEGLEMPATYYLMAWVDSDADGNLNNGEPQGAYLPESGVNGGFLANPYYATSSATGLNIIVADFGLIQGAYSNTTGADGLEHFTAAHTAGACVPFYMNEEVSASYSMLVSSCPEPYRITAYSDVNSNGAYNFGEPFAQTAVNIVINSGSPLASGVDIVMTTPSVTVPQLTWAGGVVYADTGVNSDPIYSSDWIVYRVKYSHADGLAPQGGYPRVVVKESGNPVADSPFVMSKLDNAANDYVNGVVYTTPRRLPAGSNYSYQFEAQDSSGVAAAGEAAALNAGPAVAAAPAVTYSIIDHIQAGVTAYFQRSSLSDVSYDTGKVGRDAAGNVYSVFYYDTDSVITLVKYNSTGAVIWTNFIEAPNFRDLSVDASGNIYLLISASESPVLARYDSQGAQVWVSTFGTADVSPAAVAVAPNGSVYVAGNDNASGTLIRVYKLGGNGRELWATPAEYQADGGSSDEAYDIAVYPGAAGANSVYIAGRSYLNGQNNGLLVKFTDGGASATRNWVAEYVSLNNNYKYAMATAVAVDGLGNIYAGGNEARQDEGENIWLAKYDPAGVRQWTRSYNSDQYSYDRLNGLGVDGFGNLYAAGSLDRWSTTSSEDMWLGKYSPSGTLQSSRIWDTGSGYDDYAFDVTGGTSAVYAAALINDYPALYVLPASPAGASAAYLSALEGQRVGSVELSWDYPFPLPPGSSFRVQVSTANVPAWNPLSAQVVVSTQAGPGLSQSYTYAGLATGRWPDQSVFPNYRFRVWLSSASGVYYALPEAASFAKTPFAYDITEYMGGDRSSYLSNVTATPFTGNAIAIAPGNMVYHAFGNDSGESVGFGLRKYGLDNYVQWTRFFNSSSDAYFSVNSLLRDAAGNLYAVGSAAATATPSNRNLWVAKFDAEGAFQWSSSTDMAGGNDEFYGAALDGSGGLYVAGEYDDGTDANIIVRKYNVSASTFASVVWTYTFGSGLGDDRGFGLALSGPNLYVAGSVSNGTDTDAWAGRLTLAGALASSFNYDSTYGDDVAYGVAADTAAVYLVGSKRREGNKAMYTEKLSVTLDQSGLWPDLGGPSTDAELFTVARDADGNIYGAGYEDSQGQGKNAVYGKITPAGEVLWNRYYNDSRRDGDEMAYSIGVDASGRVYSALVTSMRYMEMYSPGFYTFLQPSFGLMAEPDYTPSSVKVRWMTRETLEAGTTVYVQYSTYTTGFPWSALSAQDSFTLDYTAWQANEVSRTLYGLDNGRNGQGAPIGKPYFFKVWYSTAPGAYTAVEGNPQAQASDAWLPEGINTYPGDSKLYTMGSTYEMGYAELNGVAKGPLGNIYAVANTNWNNTDVLMLRKYEPSGAVAWTKYYSGDEYYYARANRVAADASGNIYVTGYEYAPMPYMTMQDMFLLKYNADGSLAWKYASRAEGQDRGYGVAVDTTGYIYVAGSAFRPGTYDDILLVKLSGQGVLISSTYVDGSNTYDYGYGVAVKDQHVYVTGKQDTAYDGDGIWTARFRASDLAVTASTITHHYGGMATEAAYAVAVNQTTGDVYVAGETYDTDEMAQVGIIYKHDGDLSGVGVVEAEYESVSTGYKNAAAYGLALDAAGAVYVTGTEDRNDVGQGRNLWIRKYGPGLTEEEELWTQTFHSNCQPGMACAGVNDDKGFGLAVDNAGFVYVAGRFGNGDGLYRYKQTNTLSYNPTLTARVRLGASGSALTAPFAGVGVAFIPYSQTGGIDPAGIRTGFTNSTGVFSAAVPAGRTYFMALSTQGYAPTIKDQQIDPYGRFFATLAEDTTKEFTLYPSPGGSPLYPLTVTVTTAAAGDLLMAEVFFAQTGEKAAYGLVQIPVGRSSATFVVANVPPASANMYTLGITIPNRGLIRSVPMAGAFPAVAAYTVSMSTNDGAVASNGGFEVGGSTTPPAYEGVVRHDTYQSPLEGVKVRLFHRNCVGGLNDFDEYVTYTDVNGRFAFYDVEASTIQYLTEVRKSGYSREGRGWCNAGTITGGLLLDQGAPTRYEQFSLREATFTFRGVVTYDGVPVPNAKVMVWGDYMWYAGGSDVYRQNGGMDTDAVIRTGADGSFVFSTTTANGLIEGGLRMAVEFFGSWTEINAGDDRDSSSDDIRIVLSGQRATSINATCSVGKTWVLRASDGQCLNAAAASSALTFNIRPAGGERQATLYGELVFATTFTVSAQTPLIISSGAPVTVMAMQECRDDCKNLAIGFTTVSGTYTVNTATYSVALSTGLSYYTMLVSNTWGKITSFDSRADFTSTDTVRMDFDLGRSGGLSGYVKFPNGNNYRPNWTYDENHHSLNIIIGGRNVDMKEWINVDENGHFELPNIAPGTYDLALKSEGDGFVWATVPLEGVTVTAGKTTEVQLQLANGLVVQPQILGLPEISTPTWGYVIIPVPSGTEMNQAKITEMFFGDSTFSFEYSTTTATWDKKFMLPGQYDFYLMMGAQYDPGGGDSGTLSYDHFGNFIGKVKGVAVQKSDTNPGLGSYDQPIPVNILGAIGQGTFEGTLVGERVFTAADCTRIFGNFNELFGLIPAIMIYDAAGDLKGYTAPMPTAAQFPGFELAIKDADTQACMDYFHSNPARFFIHGLPPGRYTAVFNNPNYPPVAKELELPYEGYAFDFEAQDLQAGSVSGVVISSATGDPLQNVAVYLKHRTVEKILKTAADGSYRADNLPAGIFRLEVQHEGFVKGAAKTSLAPNESRELDFALIPSQSSLSGKVYTSKFPAPVTRSGIKVVAYDETYNTENPEAYLPKLETNTNSLGEYEFTGIVPGHLYKVAAFLVGKLTQTLETTAVEGVTYMEDMVLPDVPPQISVKVRRNPDSASKVDVTIRSPKQLVSTPVCRFSPGSTYASTAAVSLALVPAPNNSYLGQFTVSSNQRYYTVYVSAGDVNKLEKQVLYDSNNEARAEQYVNDEAIQGGEIRMDSETEEYSGIELDPGSLSYSTSAASAYSVSANGDTLAGGFFSALPTVRTVKTNKGNLTIEAAVKEVMASEVYDLDLANASVNKPLTLTLKYDKEKGAGANLRIYQYDGVSWSEVPGNYTVDPMLGVVSVDVASLSGASEGTGGIATPLMRKRFGMSAVVNGRYVPSAVTTQTGKFAVFSAKPPTGVAYTGNGYEVYNMPNPFSLKAKSVTLSADVGASGLSNPYTTSGTLIKYHLPTGKTGNLKFVIYNLAGEKVRTLEEGSRTGGQVYYSEWDGKNDNGAKVASGVYFMLTYLNGDQLGRQAHKMAVIK